jgi:hypothetical protein
MDVEDLMNRSRAEEAVNTIESHFIKASTDLQVQAFFRSEISILLIHSLKMVLLS